MSIVLKTNAYQNHVNNILKKLHQQRNQVEKDFYN